MRLVNWSILFYCIVFWGILFQGCGITHAQLPFATAPDVVPQRDLPTLADIKLYPNDNPWPAGFAWYPGWYWNGDYYPAPPTVRPGAAVLSILSEAQNTGNVEVGEVIISARLPSGVNVPITGPAALQRAALLCRPMGMIWLTVRQPDGKEVIKFSPLL